MMIIIAAVLILLFLLRKNITQAAMMIFYLSLDRIDGYKQLGPRTRSFMLRFSNWPSCKCGHVLMHHKASKLQENICISGCNCTKFRIS